MKKYAALLLSLMLAASLLPAFAQTAAPAVVTIVVAGSLGDKSVNDSANEGLQMLITELAVNGKVIECWNDQAQYAAQLTAAADLGGYVVLLGAPFLDMLPEVAAAKQDVKFIYVDQTVRGIPNVMSVAFAGNEGAFLAGYVAGKLSKTHKVGAVGALDTPAVNDCLVGYRQGARYANSATGAESIYATELNSAGKGKACAKILINRGCDVVLSASGKTGEGVFTAAGDAGVFAIGMDADQKYLNPNVIVASIKKNTGLAVYAAVKNAIAGSFAGGAVWTADLAGGFVDIAYGTAEMAQQVTDEVKAEVETIKQMIIDKEIVVDSKRE